MSPSMRLSFPPVVVEDGAGSWFRNSEGSRFLDLHSMACIMNVGYGHKRVVEAIVSQTKRLLHGNPAYVVVEQTVELARRLADVTPGHSPKKVCFGLSGSDANDAAIKLARAATGRPLIISFFGAYHGNTYGALSISAVSPAMRRGFHPILPGIFHVSFPDTYRGDHLQVDSDDVSGFYLRRLEELFTNVAPPEDIAAVIVEPVQGDSGILVPPDDYLPRLKELCDRHGCLLIAEEVQTGMGRTGELFAVERSGVVPDIMVIGKALGSGMPVSAIVAASDLMDSWSAPGHVFSTSGNPVSSAAALAVLDIIEEEGILENAKQRGDQLRTGLERLAESHEVIGDVRGRGLMLGMDLVTDQSTRSRHRSLAAKVVRACFDRGCFITFLAGSVLRFAPPLIISEEEVDLALEILESALRAALSGRITDSDVASLVGW